MGTSEPAGGRIICVAPGSVAARAGVQVGDNLLAINGRLVRDQIDVQFLAAEEQIELTILRGGERLIFTASRGYNEELGLDFAELTFDGLRECTNHCPFCFVEQMPPDQRSTLYLHDDDLRYSFLHGSFITLTNLDESDWARLAEQRLSPLYVSVQATEPALRGRLLGRKDLPPIMEQLRRLADLGVALHTQLVVVPDWNDGLALERSVADLASLYPAVASIGIVPVGLTRFQRGRLRRPTAQESAVAVEQIAHWQADFRGRMGNGLAYAADEWHLLAGLPIPPAEYYDDFPQAENGIGLTRLLLDDWAAARRRTRRRKTNEPSWTAICGTLIAPILSPLLDEWAERAGQPVDLLPVQNQLFGASVSISGLLTGGDVLSALQGRQAPGRLLLPRSMFDAGGQRTLDERTPAEISTLIGAPVSLVDCLSDFMRIR